MAELDHRFVPGDRVQIHGVQKSAVKIEYSGFRQFNTLPVLSERARTTRHTASFRHPAIEIR